MPNGSRFFASMAPVTVHGPTLALVCNEHLNNPIIHGWHLNYQVGDNVPIVKNDVSGDGQALQIIVSKGNRTARLNQCLQTRSLRNRTIELSGYYRCTSTEVGTKELDELRITFLARAGKQNNHSYVPAVDLAGEQTSSSKSNDHNSDGWRYFRKQLTVPVEAIHVQISLPAPAGLTTSYRDLEFLVDGKKEGANGKHPTNLKLIV